MSGTRTMPEHGQADGDVSLELPRQTCYNNNFTQLVIMSFTIFATAGMFNALNSIGLGGDPSVGNLVNASLYGTWMITSFFAPTVVNTLGAKWSLMLGTIGYPLYALAMHYHAKVWCIVAGCFLGITAGMLWTAQGQLMMSYPSSDRVARFISIFWTIFNSGGVIGCLLSFLLNIDETAEGPEATGKGASLTPVTYWVFFAIMCVGVLLSLAVLPLQRVTRKEADGTVSLVLTSKEEDGEEILSGMALVRQELQRTCEAFRNTTLLLLIPLFFYSNFFYSYHFGVVGELFNGRTGSLSSATYWIAQILGSMILQALLDWSRFTKVQRMFLSSFAILVYIVGDWVFAGFVQYCYLASGDDMPLDVVGHLTSPIPAMVFIFLSGFVDSFVQVWSYWMMAQLSSDPEDLARFTAFYKLWQNAGAFVSFLISIIPGYTLLVAFWVNVALILVLIGPTFCAMRSAARHSMQGSKDKAEMDLEIEC